MQRIAGVFFGWVGSYPASSFFGPRRQGQNDPTLNWVSDTKQGSEGYRLACRGVAAHCPAALNSPG
jgi:hypothetical protein